MILSLPVIVTAEGGDAEPEAEKKTRRKAKTATDEVKAETPVEEPTPAVEEPATESEGSNAGEEAAE